jgi:hypothetical protein
MQRKEILVELNKEAAHSRRPSRIDEAKISNARRF